MILCDYNKIFYSDIFYKKGENIMDLLKIADRSKYKDSFVVDLQLKETDYESSMDFALSKNFFRRSYTGKYQFINDFFITHKDEFKKLMGSEGRQLKIDIKDSIVSPLAFCLWDRYRQIYIFDHDFTDALVNTQEVKIPVSVLDSLPFNTFYIDFKEENYFSQYDGVLIHVTKDIVTGIHSIVAIKLKDCKPVNGKDDDCIMYSMYFDFFEELLREENGQKYYLLEKDRLPKTASIGTNNYDKAVNSLNGIQETQSDDIIVFILQAIVYLGSYKPDIVVVTEKKHTAGKLNISKIGINYGNNIRLNKKYIKRYSNDEVKTKHKSPRCHVRCAHWHHYWTGKGRTILTVKWIPPVFVCGEKELPIKIHKIS